MEEVKEEIEKCEDGSLILLDYMQRLPAPDGFHTAQRYLQIQKASAELLKTANEKQLIVIAGAQRKREDNNKSKETAPSMDSIRESGDIEQDAHNVVILNKDYAEVAKSREGGETAKKMNIKAVKQFVFWETNGKYEGVKKEENNDNRTTKGKKNKNSWKNLMRVNQESKGT
jgi:replicative DNA helicase